ncbi:uncharacterized protein LOC103697788 [Phoenix dactylifera]|uniref:Uncharacterized protein LOC103697788 n=1 Tax=Phoenix dactylifera TaxID=42345 RepID=A0A8B7BJA2_PHODC|nr:uncharacterized protein LOC103697788 [Phoenix dactylifera]XP_008777939.1 uncharacterized protein LOC103697788 [Phoenix dactylifera]XP_008777940.1 uncharacterized protein LOC103697788 [Phoenix dactylifera]
MDPQAFVRLSIASLGLRIPMEASKALRGVIHASSQCLCEIRLRGFPVQTASVPVISTPEASPDLHGNATIFYLEKSDVKALMAPGCFQPPQAYLEIVVFMGRQGSHCGVTSRKQQIGTFRVEVGPEWGEGKPALLHNGWIGIGKNKQDAGKPGPELHLRVKLDPDPRYVFQFQDETALSPQIVQLQGTIKQPIFSCKFSRDRRASQLDTVGNNWLSSNCEDQDADRRERKGWKIMIHDLSGSAVAAAFMATPFVPSMGCDRVARSNPGAWLILRPDAAGSSGWHPWGRLEAWRETGSRDSVCLRLHLLPEGQEAGVLVSEALISSEKGGEFYIDMDRQTPVGTPVPSSQGGTGYFTTSLAGLMAGGFVMNCRVQGEGKISKPSVQLAMRHVTCVEDAAIFMALAAAVDLSIKACRPFRRNARKGFRHSFLT